MSTTSVSPSEDPPFLSPALRRTFKQVEGLVTIYSPGGSFGKGWKAKFVRAVLEEVKAREKKTDTEAETALAAEVLKLQAELKEAEAKTQRSELRVEFFRDQLETGRESASQLQTRQGPVPAAHSESSTSESQNGGTTINPSSRASVAFPGLPSQSDRLNSSGQDQEQRSLPNGTGLSGQNPFVSPIVTGGIINNSIPFGFQPNFPPTSLSASGSDQSFGFGNSKSPAVPSPPTRRPGQQYPGLKYTQLQGSFTGRPMSPMKSNARDVQASGSNANASLGAQSLRPTPTATPSSAYLSPLAKANVTSTLLLEAFAGISTKSSDAYTPLTPPASADLSSAPLKNAEKGPELNRDSKRPLENDVVYLNEFHAENELAEVKRRMKD